MVAVVAYGGLLFTVLDLNGWPLSEIDTTAKIIKTTKPTSTKIYIPAINLAADGGSVKIKGDPSFSDVTVSGSRIGFGVTPASLREASPFYNLSMVKSGDEIFLDNQGTRYVYKVSDSVGPEDTKLTIKTNQKTVVAKTVGTVTWDSGKANLQSF